MPIYQVVKIGSPELILVDASNKAQAINFVSKHSFDAKVLSPREIVSFMQRGAIVEVAAAPTPAALPQLPNVAAEATE